MDGREGVLSFSTKATCFTIVFLFNKNRSTLNINRIEKILLFAKTSLSSSRDSRRNKQPILFPPSRLVPVLALRCSNTLSPQVIATLAQHFHFELVDVVQHAQFLTFKPLNTLIRVLPRQTAGTAPCVKSQWQPVEAASNEQVLLPERNAPALDWHVCSMECLACHMCEQLNPFPLAMSGGHTIQPLYRHTLNKISWSYISWYNACWFTNSKPIVQLPSAV